MGTRGFVGFAIDSQEKIGYNHWDSYPSGLGLDVLRWLRSALAEDAAGLTEQARALRVVTESDEPTDEDVERLAPFTNRSVGERCDRPTWYQLLRESQGNPAEILRAGAIEDASGFPADSLFAEWGYVVDLDAGVFEAFEGFQRSPHSKGRFADRQGREGYQPVALAASWKFGELPSDDEFMATLGDGDAE